MISIRNKIAFLFLFILIIEFRVCSQIKLCSWNLENFGRSKSDSAIDFMADVLKVFDVVAVVEVVAGEGGTQAVVRLENALDHKGFNWDYCISEPTTGSPNKSERYAFLWKTNKLRQMGEAWLEKKFESEIEREPYFSDFMSDGKVFTIAAFHVIPKAKHPETEIKYVKFFPEEYPEKNILFCGDFNCPESDTVFNALKSNLYKPIFTKQKTSLKRECVNGEYLASEYDNVFYNSIKITFIHSGVVSFYSGFKTLKGARKISDHLPVYFEFFVK